MQTIQLPSLQTKWLGKTLYEYDEVASTQDILRKELQVSTPTGLAIVAKHQTQGRGRQGRTWFEIPGEQIFVSLLLRPTLSIEKTALLNIVAGLAICDALEELGVKNVGMKWPNDVFVTNKKISGILSELIQGNDPHQRSVIMGIGLNLSGTAKEIPAEIQSISTTLELQIGKVDRLYTLAVVLNHLEEWIDLLEAGSIKTIQNEFASRWIYPNISISIDVGGNIVTGVATNIDETGALLLQTGKLIQRIVSGDIAKI